VFWRFAPGNVHEAAGELVAADVEVLLLLLLLLPQAAMRTLAATTPAAATVRDVKLDLICLSSTQLLG
jgi:hypothetical protein